jgi:hypothetical protein
MSSARANWGPAIPLPPEAILANNKRAAQERMDNVIKEIERICSRYSFEFRHIQELIKPLEDYKRDFLSRYTIDIILKDSYHISWVNKNFENFNEIAFKIKKFLKTIEMVSQEDWSLSSFDQLIKSIPEGLHKLKQDIESKFHETLNKRLQEAREKEDIKMMIQLYEEIPNSFSKYKDTAKNFITKYVQDKIRSFLNQDQLQGLYELDNPLPKGFESLKEEIHQAVKKIVEKKIDEYKKTNDLQSLEKFYYEIPRKYFNAINKVGNELLKNQLQIKKIQEEEIKKQEQEKEEKEKIQHLKEEAEKYYEKLKNIHQEQAVKLRELFDELKESSESSRIFYINKEIKITYTRTKHIYIESEVLKEDIKTRYKEIPVPEIQQEINTFLNKDVVTKEEYNALLERITQLEMEIEMNKLKEEGRKKFVSLIEDHLKRLGYSTIDESAMEKLQKGEVVEIRTPFGEDYVIRLKYEGNMLAVRFVRYVEDENQLSTYEKEKDITIGKEWCKTYDQLLEFLKQNGIVLEEKHRIEPEQKFYYEKKEISKQRFQQAKSEDLFRREL